MRHLIALALLSLSACTGCPPSSGEDAGPSAPATVHAVHRAGFVDIVVEAPRDISSIAATVDITGAAFTGDAAPGSDGAQMDLFRQRSSGATSSRFALADSRALALPRVATVVSIPVNGAPTSVRISDATAGEPSGRAVTVTPFEGPPRVP